MYLLTFRTLARVLNLAYLRLGYGPKYWIWRHFSKMYRARRSAIGINFWKIKFCGKIIKMPLDYNSLDLEWDTALSILGHECEIKSTYERLITSDGKPDVFIDIGANYGTHSILYLMHGVKTITFEPIPVCHDYFLRACSLNRLQPDLRRLALGNKKGSVIMAFPEKETWCASFITGWTGPPDKEENLHHIEVPISKLAEEIENEISFGDQILIKIDVEGAELEVLKGSVEMIAAHNPLILFESSRREFERKAVYELLTTLGYEVFSLPFVDLVNQEPIPRDLFAMIEETNFLARRRSLS